MEKDMSSLAVWIQGSFLEGWQGSYSWEERQTFPRERREILGRGLEWHFTGMWGR